MGNIQVNLGGEYSKPTINNISKDIFNTGLGVKDEYNSFIADDYSKKRNEDQINGGISSGSSSSKEYFTDKGEKIEIWYDLTFIKLLRGRYQVLEEWINTMNQRQNYNPENPEEDNNRPRRPDINSMNFSSDEQKQAYLRRYELIQEDMTLDEIKAIRKIPENIKWRKRGKYMYQQLQKLFDKHGFENAKEETHNFLDLMNRKEARCTAGLDSFLKVLNKENTENLNNSDPTKEFYIKMSLTSYNKEHDKLYEEKKEKLEEEIKKKYLQPVQFVITEGMKEGDVIKISYGYNESDTVIFKEFDWKIPEGFLEKHSIGENVTLKDREVPYEVSNKLFDIWYQKYAEATRMIPKPQKMNLKYQFSFNADEETEFNNFINNTINEFINKRDEYEQNGNFGKYNYILPYKN
jgi:hypothetical protein